MINRYRAALEVATVAIVVVLLVVTFGGGPEHHLDGEGPLGSFGNTKSSIVQSFAFNPGGSAWTVGILLCLTHGDQPAILDGSPRATRTVGNDFRFLGAYLREITPAGGTGPIGSMAGFPPPIPDKLYPPKGFAVRYKCPTIPSPHGSVPYTELMLGFGRGSGTSGGGWAGVDVGYTAGGHHHVVTIGYETYICGSAVPSRYCLGPSPTPTPGS